MDVKLKSHFTVQPQEDGRCCFMGSGFNLNDVRLITETTMGDSVLCYKFYVYIGHTDEFKLEFRLKRKKDADEAQQELIRAWTKTSEYSTAEQGE